MLHGSTVFSGGAGGARAPPESWGSEKVRSLISAYWSYYYEVRTPLDLKSYQGICMVLVVHNVGSFFTQLGY